MAQRIFMTSLDQLTTEPTANLSRIQKISLDTEISSKLTNPKPLDDQNCPIMASTTGFTF